MLVVNNWPLLVVLPVLAILLCRNPFNTRTLIPNFEPFPDSFHYVTVARCFLNHGTWNLCREGIQQDLPGTEPSVPQAYSLALLPGFMLNFDPRSFYYTNVALTFVSLTLMYLILKKSTKNKLIQAFLLLVMATSYHVYWLPTLAMAENLLMPLYLASIVLLTINKSRRQLVGLGTVAAAIYFTKYAYAPLSVTVLLFAGLTALGDNFKKTKNISRVLKQTLIDLFFLLLPFFASLPFSLNFSGSMQFLSRVLTQSRTSSELQPESVHSYFSLSTLQTYLPKYLEVLLGKPARFLWDLRPWFPPILGFLGIFGWAGGLLQKKHRHIAGFLITSSLLQIGFMSTFYAFDTRYIYSAFFAVLIGVALILEYILSHAKTKQLLKKFRLSPMVLGMILVTVLAVVVFPQRGMPLKSQVAINLKYAETPWWYLSILEYNTFFTTRREEQPQLISLTSPFMIDYFSNNTYVVLPYDEQQDFAHSRNEVWGIPLEESLIETYTRKLEAGENLYLTTYGKEANDRFRSTFTIYETTFDLTLEQEGCYNLCNIYSVSLRP